MRDPVTPSRTARALARRGWILHGLLCLGLLACALNLGPRDAPPQGWQDDRGPVIPHDSFPADCSLCHVSGSWHEIRDDFSFDHLAETGVALEGAHQEAECLRCHNDKGPVEIFARRGCAGCHSDIHRGLLGQNCTDCHAQETWFPVEQIQKHSRTRFPLVGAHAATACYRCHPGSEVGNFSRAPVACEACHQEDLARAINPDHQAMGWVTDCQDCHLPTSWAGSGFLHSTWPLTGEHAVIDCTACHAGGMFIGTPRNCVDCHLADYNGTTDPDHAGLGFPTNCEICHNTSTWSGARFSHQGIFTGCFTCHSDDYLATTNPNHTSAGFPTNCEACHNTVGWDGANFNHTFPITSGKHNGFDCGMCHLTPGVFTSFSCTHCHEHRQSEMDDEHSGVSGYVWSSPACFMCHPDGKE